MVLQFVSKVCIDCGTTFRTSNESDKCYNCTLAEVTHGLAPEEGDFNTAGIVSGTLTERERRYLQEDLKSVELGRTTDEEWGTEEEPDDGWDDEEEDWEDDEEDEEEDEEEDDQDDEVNPGEAPWSFEEPDHRIPWGT